MQMTGARLATFVLSLALVGASQMAALAQPIQSPPAEPPGTASPAAHGLDRYDLGAAAANVLWVPYKAGTCGISAGVGAVAFILTLGGAAPWTKSAFEEGCVQNWLLKGDDFRPAQTPRDTGSHE